VSTRYDAGVHYILPEPIALWDVAGTNSALFERIWDGH